MSEMTSKDRVIASLTHREPDRVPTYEAFSPGFESKWRAAKSIGPEVDIYAFYGVDVRIVKPEMAPRSGGESLLEENEDYEVYIDGWGSTQKRFVHDSWYAQPIDFAVRSEEDFASYRIDSAHDERRYGLFSQQVNRLRKDFAVFGAIRGPFTCLWRLLGMLQSFYQMADSPDFVRRVVTTMTDLQLQIGIEELRRGKDMLGILIDDDVAHNAGMMFSPEMYRFFFFPALTNMCRRLKMAGARFIIYHSDGDFRAIIPLLIDAGVDAIHPLEARAGMDIIELKRVFGESLSFIGNIDNTGTLRIGNKADIESEVRRKLRAAKGGGYIVGTHSIGDDVPIENYDHYVQVLRECGAYPIAG